ncbi:helix-turn-helix domain-containing protein [Paenibacillus sp. GCM10012307]|uniref:Helix-turn-helix domain-containing protein n=1 Tax=Paenibacillus roseus TaxID=2798579 RepID=A0A934MTD8_9BACL|nr:helix-turn-helix domain-containing protein [Paenibacillus roseus]MBJ6359967.1 helix-turn-helix domain-containing protein [Paenibacillus roseus]
MHLISGPQSIYLDVTQAAEALGITATSLYKIINHADPSKRLEPVNRMTHRGDGGYRFRIEDVERLKGLYTKKDLTSAEAAKKIGRSTTFVHKLLHDGSLAYYEGEYRGKRTYFIEETELERYVQENPDAGKYETIYDKKSGLFLYQPFVKDGSKARLVELKRVSNRRVEATLQTEDNERLPYKEAVVGGWQPELQISDRKLNTAYGYAMFKFPIPRGIDSFIYTIIEEMFKHIGPVNMRLHVGQDLTVEVRKSVLTGILPETHPDFIDKLRLFLRSGEIVVKYDGVLIDTGLSPITVYLPDAKKQTLLRLAERENQTVQEWLEEKLERFFQ